MTGRRSQGSGEREIVALNAALAPFSSHNIRKAPALPEGSVADRRHNQAVPAAGSAYFH